MADGSVIIDTKLDQSGLEAGLASLGTNLITGITKAVAAAGAALVGLGKYALDVGSDFEYAISGVAATMGTTVDQIDSIAVKAKELGASTKFTATEAAEGFNILAMAGLSLDEQLAAIDATLSLAAAGEMSMDAAAGYLTTTVKAMSSSFREAGISMDDCSKIADMYAKGATLANTSTSQLGEAVSRAASVAGAYNQSLSTVTTSLLALAEKGYQGSQAGNYLARAMSDLYAPTANASKAIDNLGIHIYDAEGNQRDFIDIINDLNTAFEDLTEEEKAAYTGQIFTMAGLKGFNSIAGNTSEQLASLRTRLEDCAGAAEQMASTKLDNLQGAITILKSATEGFGIALYESMSQVGEGTGMMRDFVQEATDIMSGFTVAINENGFDGLIDNLGGALAKAVNKIVEYVPLLVKGGVNIVDSLVKGLAQSAGKIASSATSILSILVDGILGITSSLVELGAELVISLCNGISENVGSIAESIYVGITGIAEKILDYTPVLLQTALTLVESIATGLLETLPLLLDCVSQLIMSIVEELPNMLVSLLESLPSIVQTIVDALLACLPQLVAGVINLVNSLIGALPQVITTIVMAVQTILTNIVSTLVSAIPQIVACGVELLTSLVQALPEIIYAIVYVLPVIIKSIIDTLIAQIPLIIECGIQLLTSLIAALPQIIIAIVSVLPQIVNSVIQALLDNQPLMTQCGFDLITSLIGALPDIIVAIVAAIPTIISSVILALLENIPLIIQSGFDLFTSLIGALPEIRKVIDASVPEIVQGLADAFLSLKNKFVETGSNLLKGLGEGISNACSSVLEGALKVGNKIVNGFKSFFGIASPSKLFRDLIGKNLMLGLAEGIEEETDSAVDAVEDAAEQIADVDFSTKAVDFDTLADKMSNATEEETTSNGIAISSGSANASYVVRAEEASDNTDTNIESAPKYIQNDIYIDGKKTARVLTPYVSKELAWEDK